MSEGPTIGGAVPLGAASPPTVPQGAPQPPVGGRLAQAAAMQPPPVPQVGPVAQDPMARIVELPSGGLYYRNGLKRAIIRPTRGEQEEMLAGTPEGSPERVAAIRMVVQQCTDLQDLPFSELLVEDFGQITLHLFALAAGTDEVVLPDLGCEKEGCPLANKMLTLTTLPCVHLKALAPGEEPELGLLDDNLDPDIRAAMAVEANMGEEDAGGPIYKAVRPEDVREPFHVTLSNGVQIGLRLLRMRDLEAAEDYVRETGSTGTGVQAKLGSYLTVRQIVTIDAQKVGTVIALRWWKRTPSPLLNDIRDALRAKSFGYETRPEFRCSRTDCRKVSRVRLPRDGSVFRDRNS